MTGRAVWPSFGTGGKVDEDGFTLIEALVALALGVGVVAVVLSTLHVAANGAARAVAVASEVEGFARAGAVLAGDAAHAVRLRRADGPVLVAEARQMEFAALPRDGGPPRVLRYAVMVADGSTLTRAEAPLLASGGPGPFGSPVTIWHAAGPWALRYLDGNGDWRGDWRGTDLPRAFGLAAVTAPLDVELVAAFPELIEPDCALGPGDACSLDASVFP